MSIKNYVRKINHSRKISLAKSSQEFAQLMALSDAKNKRLQEIMREHRRERQTNEENNERSFSK